MDYLSSLHKRNKSLINYFWITWIFGIVFEIILKAPTDFILTLTIGGIIIFGIIHLLIMKKIFIKFIPYLIVFASYTLCYMMLIENLNITTMTLFFYGMGMASFYHNHKINFVAYFCSTLISIFLFFTKTEHFVELEMVEFGTFLAILLIVFGTTCGQTLITKRNEKLLEEKNQEIENERRKYKELLIETKKSIQNISSFSNKLNQNIEQNKIHSSSLFDSVVNLKNTTEDETIIILDVQKSINKMDYELKEVNEAKSKTQKIISETNISINESNEELQNIKISIEEFEKVTNHTNEQFSELVESVQKVEKIINSISEISEKTDILALNARIEAAKSGSIDKGFVVIAEEISKLAETTQRAIEDIQQANETIKEKTSNTGIRLNNSMEILHTLLGIVGIFEKNFRTVIKNGEVSKREMETIEDIINNLKKLSTDIVGKTNEITIFVENNQQIISNIQERTINQLENIKNISNEYNDIITQTDNLEKIIKNI